MQAWTQKEWVPVVFEPALRPASEESPGSLPLLHNVAGVRILVACIRGPKSPMLSKDGLHNVSKDFLGALPQPSENDTSLAGEPGKPQSFRAL